MIPGGSLVTLILIVVLAYVLLVAPIAIPGWLRTIFWIVLAIVLFAVLLNLLGIALV